MLLTFVVYVHAAREFFMMCFPCSFSQLFDRAVTHRRKWSMDERTPARQVLVRARACARVLCVCVRVCVRVCVLYVYVVFCACVFVCAGSRFLVYALGASDCMTDSDGRCPHGMHALNICKGRLW